VTKRKSKQKTGSGAAARARKRWVQYNDDDLMQVRICDLGLRIEGTPLARRIERLHGELLHRGIRFKPHVWLSSEWFSPEGIPGIAVPFYLAHPRLMRLEAKQMLEVEGNDESSCMRILRHEAGHAVDTAFRLHFKKSWRDTFGYYSKPYPQYYRPRPGSRSYVLNLDAWYAQSHPAEDFAETFAVWLKPRSSWQQTYKEWPRALRKLKYVDELMGSIEGQSARVRSRMYIEPASRIKMTIGEYFVKKRRRYGETWPDTFDRDLGRLFSSDRRFAQRQTAAAYLREIQAEIREEVVQWTGAHPYTVDQVLQDMIERCRELKLRLSLTRRTAWTQALSLITVHTMNCLHSRRHEIPL
jgi:hypothetical protein